MRGSLAALLVAVVVLAACSPPPEPAKFSYPYSFYRFDDQIAAAVTVEGADKTPTEAGFRFSFDKTSAAQWTSDSGKGRVEATGSSVVFTCGEAGALLSPAGLAIDGTATNSILLRMRVSGPSVVTMMWAPPGDSELWGHRVLRIHAPRQDKMVTYNLNTAAVKAWRLPAIDRLRFIVDSAATVEIESLQCVTTAAAFTGAAAAKLNHAAGDDIRPSLYNRCPGRISYKVQVPPQAAFTAGLAVLKADAPATFELTATADGKTDTIVSKTVANTGSWEEVKGDLSAYSGREVVLSLVSSSDSHGQVALWANPVMFERAQAGVALNRPPNVLLYVVDCLRADHLDCYGYPRETMPNVAQLARQGARFERCYAQDTWTKSSMVSLATGVDQVRHGVEQYGDLAPAGLLMLPELLRQRGYETCAVTENPHTPPETVSRAVYSRMEPIHLLVEKDSLPWRELPPFTHQAAAGFMEANRDKPFFLYVHTMEAHDISCPQRPCEQLLYDPPEPYRGVFASPDGQKPIDLYDGALAFADANLQAMLNKLDELGLADDTIVIFTGDHGEAFAEHEGYNGHGWKTFNTLIHVPLVIRYPKFFAAGTVVPSNVQLIDLAPTLLHMLGLPAIDQFEGDSLVGLAQGDARGFDSRLIFSKWFGSTSIVQGDWKLMYDFSLAKGELFNVKSDPGETTDVAGQQPRIARDLEKRLREHVERQTALHEALTKGAEESTVGIDPRVQEQLEAIGYLPTE